MILSQTEFAGLLGRSKAYITKLKQDGHLVMTADGRVEVKASMDRMEANLGNTAAARANQERWADHRARSAPPPPEAPSNPNPAPNPAAESGYGGAELLGGDLATKLGLKTKAENLRKLTADADRAQMERDVMRGKLIDRDDVRNDMATAAGVIHNAIAGVEDRLAPLMGIQDDDLPRIRALIRDEMEYLLTTIARELGDIAKGGEQSVNSEQESDIQQTHGTHSKPLAQRAALLRARPDR